MKDYKEMADSVLERVHEYEKQDSSNHARVRSYGRVWAVALPVLALAAVGTFVLIHGFGGNDFDTAADTSSQSDTLAGGKGDSTGDDGSGAAVFAGDYWVDDSSGSGEVYASSSSTADSEKYPTNAPTQWEKVTKVTSDTIVYNSLEELVKASDLIVLGEYSQDTQQFPGFSGGSFPDDCVSVNAVKVQSTIKGKAPETVKIAQRYCISADTKELLSFSGLTPMKKGDAWIFFLKYDQENDIYWCAGDYTGRYPIPDSVLTGKCADVRGITAELDNWLKEQKLDLRDLSKVTEAQANKLAEFGKRLDDIVSGIDPTSFGVLDKNSINIELYSQITDPSNNTITLPTDIRLGGQVMIAAVPSNNRTQVIGEKITEEEAREYFNKNSASLASSLTASGVELAETYYEADYDGIQVICAKDSLVIRKGYCHISYDGNADKSLPGLTVKQNFMDFHVYNADRLVAIVTLVKENGTISATPMFGAPWFESFDKALRKYSGKKILFLYSGATAFAIAPDNTVIHPQGNESSVKDSGLNNVKDAYNWFYNEQCVYTP